MNSKELYRPLIGRVIGLDALMGVGKSVTGRSIERFLLALGLKAKYFPEFVNNKLLKIYLENRKEHAFNFQSIMVRERLRIHQEASEFAAAGGIAIIDRTIYGDRSFEALNHKRGFITDEQHDVYLSLITDFQGKYDIDIIPFLDCKYETCLNRIKRRGNADEAKGYQLSDFVELETEYLKQLSEVREKVLCIDYSADLELVYRVDSATGSGVGSYYIPDTEVITLLVQIMKHLANRRRKLRASLELSSIVNIKPTAQLFERIADHL